MKAEIHDIVATGDRVALRATYSGTDRGGFIPGMPPRGKPFAMETMYIIRVDEEGRIAEHWRVGDMIGVMGQLGCFHQTAGPDADRARSPALRLGGTSACSRSSGSRRPRSPRKPKDKEVRR
jgi:SnoaL-like polyketide cyclase